MDFDKLIQDVFSSPDEPSIIIPEEIEANIPEPYIDTSGERQATVLEKLAIEMTTALEKLIVEGKRQSIALEKLADEMTKVLEANDKNSVVLLGLIQKIKEPALEWKHTIKDSTGKKKEMTSKRVK